MHGSGYALSRNSLQHGCIRRRVRYSGLMTKEKLERRRREKIFDGFKLTDGCWEWQNSRTTKGYGSCTWRGRSALAHRVVYELIYGELPKDRYLDHLCRNHACVRPGHLEPVTTQVNILRGVSPIAMNAQKTHCKYGHELKGKNVGRKPSRPGTRVCLTCKRAEGRAYQARKRLQKRLHAENQKALEQFLSL